MDSTVMLPPEPDRRWTIARQIGIDTAVVRFWGVDGWWEFETLLETRNRFADHGFSLDVVEDRPPMEKTVLGQDGRDEEIETVKRLLRNMGRLGIDTYCWVWTENPLGVLRTSDSVPLRGDSRTTAYEHAHQQLADDHPAAGITEEELWENLQYFLDEVVPVAEEAGVTLGVHPSDPPLPEINGIPLLFRNFENFKRAMSLVDSEAHGLKFCLGCWSEMGEDVVEVIRHFGGEDIVYVHFRDVVGTVPNFHETFIDDPASNYDEYEVMKTLHEAGFSGVMTPDHVPLMEGETEWEFGSTTGRAYTVGYLKGLLRAVTTAG